MKIDVNDELKNVQRPRKLRKAIMVTALILINDLAIFIAASLLLREFLQINTSEAFGPGLSVVGHLSADSLEVTVDDAQNAIFRSQSDNSAVSVRAATQHTAKLVLGKTSSPDWAIANDEQDQFTVKKGDRSFLTMNGPTTTSTISTHVDMEANTVFGSPLIMSTGGPIPTHACESDSECGAVRPLPPPISPRCPCPPRPPLTGRGLECRGNAAARVCARRGLWRRTCCWRLGMRARFG